MKTPWGALLVGAALLAPATTAQGRSGHARLDVSAQILPNCLLEVVAVSPRPLVSVKLRCAQVTMAQVLIEPDGLAGAPRPWSAAVTVARGPDPLGDTGWVANRRFIASSDGFWTASLDEEEGPPPPARRQLTVRVDF